MIWYLLYPLRGTTEAPVLAPTHPLRTVLTRYGRYAARHVVTTLLISVAVAAILLYPIPFLFTNDFINGASNLPHHVWTAAQPLPYGSEAEPDVIMRSVWVHGSYMEALNVDLLSSALGIQDELLGETEDFDPMGTVVVDGVGNGIDRDLDITQRDSIHVTNGLTSESWFFHSPLQYWGCSKRRLLQDEDILATVNKQKNLSTSAGVTLRHSIVFSGKRFEDRSLLAADALVITLLHLRDSPVGRQWERKAASMVSKSSDDWDIYQSDGHALSSQLYEFQFRPISIKDSISLALAYGLAIGYFLVSLSKLRAVKSKFGLMVTVVSQVAFSVMSSFTVCAVFNMDLSRIPRAAYPLAILSMSLENVFRLINAVILTPAEDSTSSRIGFAWGGTAPVAMASTLQNVAILLGLAHLTSPGVSAFCVFAAIAIVFDFFYLSTFFLSVLSVDVRRLELSDALDKAALQHTNMDYSTVRGRPNMIDRFLQGKMALSTRIAGTIITIGFVMIAQWHFFDDEPILHTVARLWRGKEALSSQARGKKSSLQDLHQARSPTSWLRMQDHETAEEVIKIIRPSAYSYVAQVYEPLVFVMKNSDRTPRGRQPTLLPAAYDFFNHEMSRFVVIVIVVLAALRLLTSFLLWDEEAHDALQAEQDAELESVLSVKSLAGGHALDIAMLCRSSDGHIVSVGLDRLIRLWNLRTGSSSYVVVDGRQDRRDMFPVLAIAIDDKCDWLAIVSTTRVDFWSLAERRWAPPVSINPQDRRSEAIFLSSKGRREPPAVVVVWRDGTATDTTGVSTGGAVEFTLCPLQLASAQVYTFGGADGSTAHGTTLVAATKDGHIYRATRDEDGWSVLSLANVKCGGLETIFQLLPWPSLQILIVASSFHVYLLSLESGELLYAFETASMVSRSLRCVLVGSRKSGNAANGLSSATICYTERTSGDCILQTYLPSEGDNSIAPSGQGSHSKLDQGDHDLPQRIDKRVTNPGAWDLLWDGTAIGIRRRVLGTDISHSDGRSDAQGLRQRFPRRHSDRSSGRHEYWEMWTASSGGKADVDEARPLLKVEEGAGHLIVPSVGPRVTVGLTSVAFGFGNVIKVVTVGGQQLFDARLDGTLREPWQSAKRRRKSGGPGRTKLGN